MEFGWAKDCDVGEWAANHSYFVAGVEARAGLAVFVNFVGHSIAFGDAEAEVIEELWDTSEEADGDDCVLFSFCDEGLQKKAASTLTFGFRAYDDGADFGKMGTVEMQRAATEKLSGGVVGDGEVTYVFADFGVRAAKQGAVAGEGVDEVKDVACVL